MRAHVLVALAAVLLLAAHEQRPDSAGELGQLRILENQVLRALKIRDLATLQNLLRDDYVEIIGPQRMTKAELLKSLTPSRITDYALEEVRLVPLGRDAALVTYKLAPKAPLDEKGPFASAAYVSSAWVRQDMGWLSAFRQWTPLSAASVGPQRITAFEATLTPNTVRYAYKGTTRLEDIHATFEIMLNQGTVSTGDYWATWDPGEVKEVSLDFLAFGVGMVQRIDLSATATMGGQRVLATTISRRQWIKKVPIDFETVPPTLRLP
jgi:hypothetical protein